MSIRFFHGSSAPGIIGAMTTAEVGRLVLEEDARALAEVLGLSFGGSDDDGLAWIDRAGRDNVRVARVEQQVVAGLLLLDSGQWFGGRRIPCVGIAAVGVRTDHRGSGVGDVLMRTTVEEMHERGMALSCLYPATRSFYRRSGYEPAGTEGMVRIDRASLRRIGNKLPVRAITSDDLAAVELAYDRSVRARNGPLDRLPYHWHVIRNPRGARSLGYLVEGDGGVEGYVYLTEKRDYRGRFHVRVLDLVALTTDAAHALLGLLGSYSMSRHVVLRSHPSHELLLLLPERTYRIEPAVDWCLRLVDVTRALEERGYPQGLEAEVHFDVADDVLPANAGPYVLRVADGRGRVERGGRGELRIDVRALAALYSSFQHPEGLRVGGLLEGSAEAAAAAAAVFAGPAPWLLDDF